MAKEVVNNSIKYAECNNIKAEFKRNENRKHLIIIQDDGKGFSSDDFNEGNGLKNLHYRAEQIKYNVQIDSSIGAGTYVKIEEK